MRWDGDKCVWLNTGQINPKAKTVRTGEPQVEFDESNREIRLTIHKRFPKIPDIIVRVNTRDVKEFKQEWCFSNSSEEIIVFPCSELYEHREYEDNLFKVNIGAFEKTLNIPAKTEVLNIRFSSLSLKRSVIGSLSLTLGDIKVDSESIKNKIKEIRFPIDEEETLCFLEEICSGNKIKNSDISNILGLKFRDNLHFDEVELNLHYEGDIDQANGLDQLNSSKDSSNYFCATFNKEKMSSRSILVNERDFTLPLGNDLTLTVYSIVVKNGQQPSLYIIRSDDSTPEKIPLHPDIVGNFAQEQTSTFLPIHTFDNYLNYIFWENSSEMPEDIRLEVNLNNKKICFEIPSGNKNTDSTMIIIPKQLFFRGVNYLLSSENIVFSIPKESNESSTANDNDFDDRSIVKCLSSKELDVNSLSINRIINRIKIKIIERLFRGRKVRLPELVLKLDKDDWYDVGGYDERYRTVQGIIYFDQETSTIYPKTEIHIISSKVDKMDVR